MLLVRACVDVHTWLARLDTFLSGYVYYQPINRNEPSAWCLVA